MIDLEKYLYKNVRLIDSTAKEYFGYVEMFSTSEDSGDEEDSIGLMANKDAKSGRLFFRSEIKSIELI